MSDEAEGELPLGQKQLQAFESLNPEMGIA